MNSRPPSKAEPRAWDSIILRLLITANILVGVVILPVAIQIGFTTLSFSTITWPDFTVYYAAARIVHTSANALYNLPDYQDLYLQLYPKFSIAKADIIFPYLSPPTLAFLLYPLGFLPLTTAFLSFSSVNVALLLILAVQVRTYVRHSPLEKKILFLQSLLLCLFPVFNVFCQGQISLIVCVLSMSFLLDLRAEKYTRSGLWLALAIHIKPQYFVPLLFVLAGQRKWKALAASLAYAFALVLLSTLICGVDIWQHYISALFVIPSYTRIHLPMVNFREILELLWGKQVLVSWITSLCYLGVCIYAALGSYLRPHNDAILPVVIALSLFFSPYMLSHDMLLFLPVGLSVALVLYKFIPTLWLFLGCLIAVWGPDITFAMGGDLIPFYLCNCMIGLGLTVAALWGAHSRKTAIIVDSGRRNL